MFKKLHKIIDFKKLIFHLSSVKFLKLFILISFLCSAAASASHMGLFFQYNRCKPGSQTFSYAGGLVSFTAPTGCRNLKAKIWGAGGGGSANSYSGSSSYVAGGGGYSEGVLSISQTKTVYIVVGGGGYYYGNGGYPGGGTGLGDVNFTGGGGGGYSGIFSANSLTQSNAIMIAGAGGGSADSGGCGNATQDSRGGAGGGATAQNGGLSSSTGGDGGSQAGGGAGRGFSYPGCIGGNGGQLAGGTASVNGTGAYGTGRYGSGGGGGYFGGGAGGQINYNSGCVLGGGGGGSGYVSPTLVTNSVLTTGNYQTQANANDPDNQGAGAGGYLGSGANGKIVLYWY
jgi:hypothetical protein